MERKTLFPPTAHRPPSTAFIRWMIRRDLDAVFQIEDDSFPDPWTAEDFYRCLRQRNCIGMVAEVGDQVAGFMVYELNKWNIQLLDLAVAPEARRRGVGRQLVEKLKAKLFTQRRRTLLVKVGERNDRAHAFFAACGLRATGVLRREYDDGQDAYLFRYDAEGARRKESGDRRQEP